MDYFNAIVNSLRIEELERLVMILLRDKNIRSLYLTKKGKDVIIKILKGEYHSEWVEFYLVIVDKSIKWIIIIL